MDEFPTKSGSNNMEQDKMEESHEDLYAKLESQENDLMLAAELGKALLDKNEEISKDREDIVLNYLHNLEVKLLFLFTVISSLLCCVGSRAREISSEKEDGSAGGRIPAASSGATCRHSQCEESS